MSETITMAAQAEQTGFLQRASANLYVRAGAVVAGAVLLTGCSGNSSPEDSGSISSASASAAAEACGVPLDLNANSANKNYGSPEALFPSLQTTDKSGNVKLVDTKDAVKTVQGTLATDYRGLATYMSYVVNPRENLQLPDAQTLGRADALEESYKNNPELAAKDAVTACESAAFLVSTDKFALTKNQGTKVVAQRNAQGEMIAESTQRVAGSSAFPAFEVGYNKDDASLSADDKAKLDKAQSLLAINGNGVLVMNDWLGNATIKVDANGQPVKPNNNGQTASFSPSPSPSANSNNGGGDKNTGGGVTSGNTPENNPGPNTQGPSGPNPEASNSASETTPAGGNTPTPKPSPSETPTHRPTPTPTPTKPTPTPTPTHSTPTPTPTPTPTKGSEPPCVPNPPYVIC